MTKLPPAVLAYLEQATTLVAQQQNFSPTSEKELANWLNSNLAEVIVKAKELQFNCWLKLASNRKAQDLVSQTITKQIWSYHNQPSASI